MDEWCIHVFIKSCLEAHTFSASLKNVGFTYHRFVSLPDMRKLFKLSTLRHYISDFEKCVRNTSHTDSSTKGDVFAVREKDMRDFAKYSKRVTFYTKINLGQKCLEAKSDETFSLIYFYPYKVLKCFKKCRLSSWITDRSDRQIIYTSIFAIKDSPIAR